MRLLQKWQKCLDKIGVIGTFLMDLSKAYDCINYDILLAKLNAYGFSYYSLVFLSSYLKNCKQMTKIGSVFSKWLEVALGIPQGSILGPLIFSIFINNLFEFVLDTDIFNFADDNTLKSFFSKIFERIIYDQMYVFFKNLFSDISRRFS